MRKFLRYLIQYAILGAFAFFVYQTAFKRDTPPVHDRAAWSQRDGFVAISYGGVSIEDENHFIITKKRLRRQLQTLSKAGYHTITTSDIRDFYDNNKPLPEKALYLMFEGGRKDSVLFTQPILVDVGFNAALYLYGDRLKGWNRFFVRDAEVRKVASNPFWDVNAMGYHSGLINLTGRGGYSYYLTSLLDGPDGKPDETQEAFDARVAKDYQMAYASIEDITRTPPLGYLFMPANTLGVSLRADLAKPNLADLRERFPVAFTHVGELYNSRTSDPHSLTRMQVGPDWTAERLLLEIESRLPKSRFLDFSSSVRQGLWQVTAGDIAADGQQLALSSLQSKDAFARLRGSESFENFLCQVKVVPASGGSGLLYLRYRDAGSFARIQVTPDRVLVQEKNDTSLNTIFQYTLPLGHSGPVEIDCCVKSNRLLLQVNGKNVSPYPIPLTAETTRGSFALGSLTTSHTVHKAVFLDLRLTTFPPRWVQAPTVATVPLEDARTLTTMVLPASSLTKDPVADAAALVRAATNGVTAFLDLSDADAATIEETTKLVTEAPTATVFTKLLRGFVLSVEAYPELSTLGRTMQKLQSEGYAVALRLTPAAKARLLDEDAALHPDWLLFDMPPDQFEQDITVLQNRFDKTRMLFRVSGSTKPDVVFYEVKG